MAGVKLRNEKTIIRELDEDEDGNLTVKEKVQYVNPRYNGPNAEVCTWDIWDRMPVYDPKDLGRQYGLDLTFETADDLNRLIDITGFDVTPRTIVCWFPESSNPRANKTKRYFVGDDDPKHQPQYPIYIVSKSRFEKRPTSDALVRMKIPHFIVVEAHQYDEYKSRVNPEYVTVLILDQKYLDEYDTFDDLGYQKSKGPGAARNFAWDHSISIGAKFHWVMDDNASHFQRLWKDKRPNCHNGAIFRAMEDHVNRYDNVYIAGPNYSCFAKPVYTMAPIVLNTRIYSFLLIRNDIKDNEGNPYRWRGRYNEDTDLCLRVLKDGHATMQYNAFMADKITTQRFKGGNTEEFYDGEGTNPKSEMLVNMHPDVAKRVWKFQRWHHEVDYSGFKNNDLGLKPEFAGLCAGNYEYGMTLVEEQVDSTSEDDQLNGIDLVEEQHKPKRKMTDADMSAYRDAHQNLGDIPDDAKTKRRRFIISFLTPKDVNDFKELTGFDFPVKQGILVPYHVDFNRKSVDNLC